MPLTIMFGPAKRSCLHTESLFHIFHNFHVCILQMNWADFIGHAVAWDFTVIVSAPYARD